MSPPQWHPRVPFFCDITGAANVTCDNNQQAVVDAEIEFAAGAGLDYWAFDTYPDDVPLSIPLQMYMSSTTPGKGRLRFCHLLQAGWMSQGGLPAWPAKVSEYVDRFTRADYQKVEGNRPLVYIFAIFESAWRPDGSGTWADWTQALSMLRNATLAAGLGAPYIVSQDFSPNEGWANMAAINGVPGVPRAAWLISALSSYLIGQGATDAGAPFDVLPPNSVAFWEAAHSTGADVVPVVTAGFDPRPMNETHLPWQNYTNPAWIVQPTMPQLADFVQLAINWTLANAAAVPAQTIMLSAWNEFAEGHYIAPNLPQYGGSERLQAIGSVIAAARAGGR